MSAPSAGSPYAAPYAATVHPRLGGMLVPPAPPARRAVGIMALLIAGIAALTPIAAAVAAYQVGLGAGQELTWRPPDAPWEWAVLAPVRGWVLLGEIAFWSGTALGLWAIVQGIVAIARRRGRPAGIAAVVIAVLTAGCFVLVAWIALFSGIEASSALV